MDQDKLIENYFNDSLEEINKSYPELLSNVNIEDIKNKLTEGNPTFIEFKGILDLYVKEAIANFLNRQFDDKSKKNVHFNFMPDEYSYLMSKSIVEGVGDSDLVIDRNKFKTNLSVEESKKIVLDFFASINQQDPEFASEAYNQLLNIKVYNHPGRSYSNDRETVVYYTGNLADIVTIAHEVSHKMCSKNSTIPSLREIESLMTESMFIKYLYDNKIECISDHDTNRILDDEDLDYMELMRMGTGINSAKRTKDEVDFKNMYFNNNSTIDISLLDRFSESNSLPKVIDRSASIKNIAGCYFSDDPSFDYSREFDSHNGKHLENEMRFMYGSVISNHFVNTCGSDKKLYYEYMKNPGNYSNVKKLGELLSFNPNNTDILVDNYAKSYVDLEKRVSEQLKREASLTKEKSNVKRLVRESNLNNGFVSTLVLSLLTGFAMGIVATLAYIFINK